MESNPAQPRPNRVIKVNRNTAAAKLNLKMLRGLEAALLKDPEADMLALLRPKYAERLQDFKRFKNNVTNTTSSPGNRDVRAYLDVDEDCHLLSSLEDFSSWTGQLGIIMEADGVGNKIVKHLESSTLLYKGIAYQDLGVFRITLDLVAKVTVHNTAAQEEYDTLHYLAEHLPTFPAPKPRGLIRLGEYSMLFMDYIPGSTLESVWPSLNMNDKKSLRNNLNELMDVLRQRPFQEGHSYGGVKGTGCKDARQSTYHSSRPITSHEQFLRFMSEHSRTASRCYEKFLREMMPSDTAVKLTHGDLRPANIMVKRDNDGSWVVTGIIDWEAAGFYPDYWEAVKMTNNLTPAEDDDWYNYLPECVSPSKYATQWLVDRLWDFTR